MVVDGSDHALVRHTVGANDYPLNNPW